MLFLKTKAQLAENRTRRANWAVPVLAAFVRRPQSELKSAPLTEKPATEDDTWGGVKSQCKRGLQKVMPPPDFVKLLGNNRHENRMQQVKDQRRYPRVRFGRDCRVRIGYRGAFGEGLIENLSPGGLMLRSDLVFEIGRSFGCEFSLDGATLIDLPCTVVSRVGDLFGARFHGGPLSQVLIGDAIEAVLASGVASVLSVHELAGRKVLRIVGGLNDSLRSDFMHVLTKGGIDEIDVQGVSKVDAAGMALCVLATGRHGVRIGPQSAAFADAWKQSLAVSGGGEEGWN